jgi:non-specific serine/threonine protein kinase
VFLRERLAGRPCLLVLDNLEQLVEGGGAERIGALLADLPELSILATSRRLLGLPGERGFPVPPLPTPDGPAAEAPERLSLFESVALFVDRAQAVKPHFQVTNQNAPAVAQLCQKLEGIPLAIELAAARSQVMSPGQMLEQLSRRFDLLVTRQRGIAERHRSLHAAVDWSYNLLAPGLQRFFCRLSVFRGRFRAGDAEAVCEEPLALDHLAQLVECSMVRAETIDEGIYFGLLETFREFGSDHLLPAERVVWEGRFIRRFASLKYHWAMRPSFRSALQMARETEDVDSHLRLAANLWHFYWSWSLLDEGVRALQEALGRPEGAVLYEARAMALGALYSSTLIQGNVGDARAVLGQIRSLWQDAGDLERAEQTLDRLCSVRLAEGDYDEAERLLRRLGSRGPEGAWVGTLSNDRHDWGRLEWHRGDFAAARHHFEESLRTGEFFGINHQWLARVALAEGDAQTAYTIVAEYYRGHAHWPQRAAEALEVMGLAAARLGRHEEAEAHLRESLRLFFEIGMRAGFLNALTALAEASSRAGRASRAVQLYGAAESLRETLGRRRPPWCQAEVDADLSAQRTALGEAAFEAIWSAGRAMDWEAAVAFARGEGRD